MNTKVFYGCTKSLVFLACCSFLISLLWICLIFLETAYNLVLVELLQSLPRLCLLRFLVLNNFSFKCVLTFPIWILVKFVRSNGYLLLRAMMGQLKYGSWHLHPTERLSDFSILICVCKNSFYILVLVIRKWIIVGQYKSLVSALIMIYVYEK